ncbi:entericidin, EcnA/B family [Pseudorhodobacter sp.]|nr:entericidin, EcnA/B family [Pseudorhodobacter sp.]MDN5787537.1 entericidin, EcnA/B family [Pseudorhodobacter sp.]
MTFRIARMIPIAALLLLSALSACGTIDGIGRDISGASNRVSNML